MTPIDPTPTDFAKITQMLDAGWIVQIERDPGGGYHVKAKHRDTKRIQAAADRLWNTLEPAIQEALGEHPNLDGDGTTSWLLTDDHTPEQALTRMAYLVRGEYP